MINNEDFLYIEDCKNDIDRIIKDVNVKCENIEQIYKEYIKEAVSKEEFVSTLDKMLFQIEITRQDTENCIELYRMFIYKIYGQYYKFYIKIINILQNLDSFDFLKEIQIKNFRSFTDIEYTFYSFEEIQSVHNSITEIINNLEQTINRRIYVVNDDTTRLKKGININELVYEKHYTVEILKQKKELFQKILFDYYRFQKKFFERIKLKLKVIFYHIEKDVETEFVSYSENESRIRNTKTSIETLLVNDMLERNDESFLQFFYSVIKINIKKLFSYVCIYE